MLQEQPDVNNNTAMKREPTATEIREQLELILGSRCFEQAGRSSKFLRFAAEQTLAGLGERLKGYTIAVEVFGRPADFDAQNDPLVRVEAGRLRRRLAEYYAGEGKRDELRVDLPRGGYAVVWSYVPAVEPPARLEGAPAPASSTAQPGAAPPKRRRRRLRAWVIAALLVALSALVVVQQLKLSSRADRDFPTLAEALARSGKPPIVVMPFEDLSAQAELRGLADALTEETLLSLNEPELFAVATEPGAGAATGAGGSRVVIPVNIGLPIERQRSRRCRRRADHRPRAGHVDWHATLERRVRRAERHQTLVGRPGARRTQDRGRGGAVRASLRR
jgi:adenylate cyclase